MAPLCHAVHRPGRAGWSEGRGSGVLCFPSECGHTPVGRGCGGVDLGRFKEELPLELLKSCAPTL